MPVRLFVFALLLLGSATAQEDTRLVLATTTSTDNSGLLEFLLPPFEAASGFEVQVVAVGTGAALKLGAGGDADVLLVHAPEAERELVEAGGAVNRRLVMYNDFVLVGPEDDPTGITETASATEALQRIRETGEVFVSRGDDSGTHKKELELWGGVAPEWEGYLEVGQGMEATLLIADERRGYTLTDRGTFLAAGEGLELNVLYEGDEALFNPYHVMAVSPQEHPEVDYAGAMALIAFVTSPEGQALIERFSIDDQALFFPAARTVPFD